MIASEKSIIARIESSETFTEYANAFCEATGLPLEITEANQVKFALCSKTHGDNRFCKLMSKSGYNCDTCRLLNQTIIENLDTNEQSAFAEESRGRIGYTEKSPQSVSAINDSFWQQGPKTFECFAGMCESLVPIETDGTIIGFLKTGQVLLNKPTKSAFRGAIDKILDLDPSQDDIQLETSYFNTPVLAPKQYEAMVMLLKTFAVQLSSFAHNLMIEINHEEPRIVQNAKKVIQSRFCEPLILEEIARSVSISPFHLSRTFKESTGSTVLEYLSFVRIEHAKELLIEQDRGIAEIAFQVGFGSLAPFNKAFKKFTSLTPKSYRIETLKLGTKH